MVASEQLLMPVEDTDRLPLRCHSRVGYLALLCICQVRDICTFNFFVLVFACHAAVHLYFFSKQILPREKVKPIWLFFPLMVPKLLFVRCCGFTLMFFFFFKSFLDLT